MQGPGFQFLVVRQLGQDPLGRERDGVEHAGSWFDADTSISFDRVTGATPA
ncbi:hypothetical protein BJQ89_02147 [Arthrobacter sp. ES1]|nr:hypothetical protein [Arthrobacter sp. ES1]